MTCNSLDILADGKPVALTFYRHGSQVGRGFVTEIHYVNIAFSDLKQLANASVVEFKYCTDEFTLTPDHIKDIAEFADVIIKD